jgi:hypothetical protein
MELEATIQAFVDTTVKVVAQPTVLPTPPHVASLALLGDEIAELSAHLDAATARLLTLIREFDEREGWAMASARARSG